MCVLFFNILWVLCWCFCHSDLSLGLQKFASFFLGVCLCIFGWLFNIVPVSQLLSSSEQPALAVLQQLFTFESLTELQFYPYSSTLPLKTCFLPWLRFIPSTKKKLQKNLNVKITFYVYKLQHFGICIIFAQIIEFSTDSPCTLCLNSPRSLPYFQVFFSLVLRKNHKKTYKMKSLSTLNKFLVALERLN